MKQFPAQRPSVPSRDSIAAAVELALQEAQEHAHLVLQLRDAILAKDQHAVNACACRVAGLPPMEILK